MVNVKALADLAEEDTHVSFRLHSNQCGLTGGREKQIGKKWKFRRPSELSLLA